MDIGQMSQAQALYNEFRLLERAEENFSNGGTITEMTISQGPVSPEETGNPAGVMIPTRNIAYPPQMKDAILEQLRQRRSAITAELASMGVTGAVQSSS